MNRKRNSYERSRSIEIITRSPAQTQLLGSRLAESIPIPGVIMLQGALGTGKTTLARGIAQGLGLDDHSLVSSPSFALVNIYNGRCRIYHVDLYRLSGNRDLYSTGIDDFLGVDGITIVEWGDRLLFPVEAALKVELTDGGDDSRILRICWCQGLVMRASRLAAGIGSIRKSQKDAGQGNVMNKF
jgi:tRNA threonylcarbamoyladenosine biosynthesis protein TsaE